LKSYTVKLFGSIKVQICSDNFYQLKTNILPFAVIFNIHMMFSLVFPIFLDLFKLYIQIYLKTTKLTTN